MGKEETPGVSGHAAVRGNKRGGGKSLTEKGQLRLLSSVKIPAETRGTMCRESSRK